MLRVSSLFKKAYWDEGELATYTSRGFNPDEKNAARLEEWKELPRMTAQKLSSGALDHLLEGVPGMESTERLNTWARKQYKVLGRGSSRKVFELDADHVMKLATDQAGVDQNLVESHVAQKFHDLPITRVHYVAPKGVFLVVDLAHELNEEHFKSQFGLEFQRFCRVISVYKQTRDTQTFWEVVSAYPNLEHLLKSLQSHGLLMGDLGSPSQWGDFKNKPVLLDYGATQDVWDKHYKRYNPKLDVL